MYRRGYGPGKNLRSGRWRWLFGAAIGTGLLSIGVPLVAGRAPTSLLPPGFGDTPPATEQPASPALGQQTAPGGGQNAGGKPPLQLDLSELGPAPDAALNNSAEVELTPEELAAQQEKYDLPDSARRSLDRIGPLTPATGGVAPEAFGNASGRYLAALMRATRAPLASRWGSILLRRVLLSATDTPGDIDGADWAAERAWLLVRMGEADAARMMVQSVDADRYSTRLYAVAMQAYLASADPVGLCPLYQRAKTMSDSPSWQMAEAICASFSAEQGQASAILNQAERRGRVTGIDYRLTEKIVGAGTDSRRSVKIEWDGVDRLTAWRFGLATAANVDIPPALLDRTGSHVLAWRARAPMLSVPIRVPAVETAARLGVFSGAALVDFYAELPRGDELPEDVANRADTLRLAYAASTVGGRVDAMRELWSEPNRNFIGLLATARAAAALPVSDVSGEDFSALIAAMMCGGYDISAIRWARSTTALDDAAGVDGWAMLAVGAPRPLFGIDTGRLRDYVAADGLRGEMLVAGLAGLGRIGGEALQNATADAHLPLAPRGKWARAIDAAAQRGEKGTVALLAAVGMQTQNWGKLPPEHLYHIVSALRRVGLDAEARMIAAEAIVRT